jgi:hypothetical protein
VPGRRGRVRTRETNAGPAAMPGLGRGRNPPPPRPALDEKLTPQPQLEAALGCLTLNWAPTSSPTKSISEQPGRAGRRRRPGPAAPVRGSTRTSSGSACLRPGRTGTGSLNSPPTRRRRAALTAGPRQRQAGAGVARRKGLRVTGWRLMGRVFDRCRFADSRSRLYGPGRAPAHEGPTQRPLDLHSAAPRSLRRRSPRVLEARRYASPSRAPARPGRATATASSTPPPSGG